MGPVLAEAYNKAKEEQSKLHQKLTSLQSEKDAIYAQFEALQVGGRNMLLTQVSKICCLVLLT